jgi:RNA polymerase sigma-70 factor (ECF subfamily)
VFSEHWGRLLALLVKQLRSLDVAEESLADAFELALKHWNADGVPDRPEAWLLTTARRRGLDRLRREATLARKLPLLIVDGSDVVDDHDQLLEELLDEEPIPDERLRLIFTCCHPALAMEARIALTLRMVGGLTTPEIARAFLVSESTMAARLTRAKKKIATAGVPYRVPGKAELPERLAGVLAVLYLVFTEGHSATSGAELVRGGLCAEAIRLCRVVAGLLPGEPDPPALLALLLFQHSRRDARTDADGRMVLLADQDRGRWDREEITEGLVRLREALAHGQRTPYLLQAAIASQHATAVTAAETDWAAIAGWYEQLEELTGSPIVRLNRAVAVAEAEGPAAAMELLAGLEQTLPDYHLLPATRADFLRRLGDAAGARLAYEQALELVRNDTEREFLARRLAELEEPDERGR